MINSDDLATLTIRRVIFHDVPSGRRGGTAEPILAEDLTALEPADKLHLKTKLTQVLNSTQAHPVVFSENTASPVPEQVRSFTLTNSGTVGFVAMSRTLALYLAELQHGGISPGLLCVMDVTASSRPAVVLMKLEREEGAQLQLTEHGGKRVFDMSLLRNLVLTQGTRLFKAALFLRAADGDDAFRSAACDSQTNIATSDHMARFWLTFLGCSLTLEPKLATEYFYESALDFINTVVSDPVDKDTMYEHLQSQMKTTQRSFSPARFVRDYVPAGYQAEFIDHLQADNAFSTFSKDTGEITSRLRTSAYITEHGVKVSVPSENSDRVDVSHNQIVVNDSLVRVDRK